MFDRVTVDEFDEKLAEVRWQIDDLTKRFEDNSPQEQALQNSSVDDVRTALEELAGVGARLTAPVRIPSQDQMEIKLIPTWSFDRLEEYRTDENKWYAIASLPFGAVIGILINLITGSEANQATWVALILFAVFGILSLWQALVLSKRAAQTKSEILSISSGRVARDE